MVVQGTIKGDKLNLINVYGPNNDDPGIYTKLFLTVSSLSGQNIIADDLSCTLYPAKDRSTEVDHSHINKRKLRL